MVINGDINGDYPIIPTIWNGKLSQPDRWLSHYIMFYEPWWLMVINGDY